MTRYLRFGIWALWILSIATSGCGGGSGSGDQGANGPTTGGAGGAGNSSSGGTGQTGGAGGTSAGKSNVGQLFLLSIVEDQFNRVTQVSAQFYTSPQTCPFQTYGDCIVRPDCTSLPNYVSAGTLTITSPATTTLPANNITMTPNADYTYSNGALSGPFGGTEAVHVAASGATVPAFSADLTAPLALLIDSPTADANGIISANRSSDLVIQFSRGVPGVALVAQYLSGGFQYWIECTSAPGASSLTIPKAALDNAASGLYLLTWSSKEITAGDFTVMTGIIMNAFTPDKQHPVVINFN